MKSNKCDVIITYCWNRVGYNILRRLTSHGLSVWCADISSRNICSMSNLCAGSFVYPDYSADEKAFIDCLIDKVRELHPIMLLPTHDESIVIMRHRNEFPHELIIPYDCESKLIALSNKAISTQLAKKAGLPIPEVYSSIDNIYHFPVVIKAVIGNSAKDVYIAKSKQELIKIAEEHKNEDTLIEEWIGGSDYSVDVVRWNSFCKTAVYHALVTKTEGGGTTTQREIVFMPELEAEAIKLVEAVDFRGVCGIDFRYDPTTNRMAFIEVNARFTGGIATPIAAGFDIPWVLYKLATEGTYDDPITIKLRTKTKWILGDIITIISRLVSFKWCWKELKSVFSFKGFDAFDDYYSDDKKAILGESLYYFIKLIKNRRINS